MKHLATNYLVLLLDPDFELLVQYYWLHSFLGFVRSNDLVNLIYKCPGTVNQVR